MMASCCGNNMQKENEELVEKCANATHLQSVNVQICDAFFFWFPLRYIREKSKKRDENSQMLFYLSTPQSGILRP